MTKNLKLSLLFLFLFQLLVAANFDLAHDEAYYWLFSKNLDWGYFDHPPFMAVIVRIFSFLPHTELSVRLGFIGLQFGTLFILLKLIEKQKWALVVMLFFAFPLASLTGLLAIPDMPLLFMTACYCYFLKEYLEKLDVPSALKLGVTISLLLYAKYHGILLVFFTVVVNPRLILRKEFYLVMFVSIVLFLPHAFWQYEHQFATLRYHFLERPAAKFSFSRSLEFIGLQVVLAGVLIGPIVWWITAKFKSLNSFERSLKAMSFGIVVFFLISSFTKRIEANWTIYLAIPLILISAQSDIWNKRIPVMLLAFSFFIVMISRILFLIPYEWSSIARIQEFQGWRKWTLKVQEACGSRPIMANTYQVASKLSYYLNQNIPALNLYSRKNQFDYWNFQKDIKDQDICYLTDKIEFPGKAVFTPDGKELKAVTNLSLATLLDLKEQRRIRDMN